MKDNGGAGVSTRRQQVALVCSLSRSLRDLARGLAWSKLSEPERRRIARALERLESDLILARILARSGAPDLTLRGDRRRHQEDDAV